MTVTTTNDESTPNNGACSLREAIQAVDAGTSSSDCGAVVSGGTTTITVPAGHYTLSAGELKIGSSANLAIEGANAANPSQTVIDANHLSRMFEVVSGGQATFEAIEVTGGTTANGADGPPGGSSTPAGNGGGILNDGTLTLRHVLVTGNRTGHGGNGSPGDATISAVGGRSYSNAGNGATPGGYGGGIDNDSGATLAVESSTITANTTGAGGTGGSGADGVAQAGKYLNGGAGGPGAGGGTGGGIYNAGSATLETTTVSGNATGRNGNGGQGGKGASDSSNDFAPGGAGGTAGGEGCTDNGCNVLYGAAADGGGIATVGSGSLSLSDSTLSGNTTGAGGTGGNGGNGASDGGANSAHGGNGGHGGPGGSGAGLFAQGTATLTNVTIQGNTAGAGGHGGDAGSTPVGGGTGGDGGSGARIYGGSALVHVTIAQNVVGAAGTGGVGYDPSHPIPGNRGSGAGIDGAPTETNSIVSSNGSVTNGDHNCVGSVSDGGHDITFNDATCPGTNADPALAALADNGGPTRTMLPGAAAIDIVPAASCSVTHDQRLFPRPDEGEAMCDVGAVETGPAPNARPTVTSVSCSPGSVAVGAATTCTATATDTGSGSATTPTGTISFASDSAGAFGSPGASCTPSGAAGSASCGVQYTPAAVGSGVHAITASSAGDAGHAASAGHTDVAVTAKTSTPASTSSSPGQGGAGSQGGGTGTGSANSSGGGGTGPGSTGALASVGAITLSAGVVKFTVTCPLQSSGPCDVTATLATLEKLKGGKLLGLSPLARRPRRRVVVVGSVHLSLSPGRTARVSLRLNRQGRTLVARRGRLPATLTVTERASGRSALLARDRLTIRRAHGHRRHRHG